MSIKVPAYESPSLLPNNFHDVRDEAVELALRNERVRKKNSGRKRPWNKVTGICLHQTAVELGERPGRWASLGAHIGITRSGKIIWVHDFDKIIYHGNGWNNRTVGIEIDGGYEGILGERNTFWDGGPLDNPQQLTEETVEASKAVIEWVYDFVARRGGEVKFLVAHRQSSRSRRGDPGEAIWKRVAMPMQEKLGLSHGGHGFKIGGRAIPEEWDPSQTGVSY